MGLSSTFKKLAMTGFKIAGDTVQTANYTETHNDGFEDVSEQKTSLKLMTEFFKIGDDTKYSFGSDIQKSDIKGLVPSLSATIPLIVNGVITSDNGNIFIIKGVDIDPAGALYILLLRKYHG